MVWLVPIPAGLGATRLDLLKRRVFDHFAAQFPLAQPTVPIAWQGKRFDPDADAANRASWVRITVLPGARPPKGMGPQADRDRVALVQVETHVAADGDAGASDYSTALAAAAISDSVEAVFDAQRITGLRLRAPETLDLGIAQGDRYYRHLTRIEVSQLETPT